MLKKDITIKINSENAVRGLAIFAITFLMSFNMIKHYQGIIFLLCLTLLLFICYVTNKSFRYKNKLTGIYSFFIFWLVWAMCQLMFVEHGYQTMINFSYLFIGIWVIWIMTRFIDSKERIEMLFKIWGVTLLFSILIGWWEIITFNHLPTSRAYGNGFSNVATAGFYNENDYSFFLILGLPIMLYWMKKRTAYKLIGLFMMVSSFYFHYMNGARLILVVFFAVICVHLINLVKNNRKQLIFFITIILISIIYFRDFILASIDEIMTVNSADNSVSVRQMLIDSALNIFDDNFFGVGPGNLVLYMPKIGENVHNFWLENLVNYGIFVFVCLVLFFVVCLYKMFKTKGDLKEFINPIFWSTLIFIPTSVVPSTIFQMNLTWFLFGVITCAINVINKNMNIATNNVVSVNTIQKNTKKKYRLTW